MVLFFVGLVAVIAVLPLLELFLGLMLAVVLVLILFLHI